MLKKGMMKDEELDNISGGVEVVTDAIETMKLLLAQPEVTDYIDRFIRKYRDSNKKAVHDTHWMITMTHKFDMIDPDVLRDYVYNRYENA